MNYRKISFYSQFTVQTDSYLTETNKDALYHYIEGPPYISQSSWDIQF